MEPSPRVGRLWGSLGRLGRDLEAALPLPADADLLVVVAAGVGFRVRREPAAWEAAGELPPLDPPPDVWDLEGDVRVSRGRRVAILGSHRRPHVVAAIRAYLADPAAAELETYLPRIPQRTRRLRRR